MTIDHDRLYKELLQTFFKEFVELFFPEAADVTSEKSQAHIEFTNSIRRRREL